MASPANIGLLLIFLSFLGVAYLFLHMFMAIKQRGIIVWIAFLNVAVFAYMAIFNPFLITKYALSFEKIASGHGYTLLSYMFTHANLAHITLNTFGLLFFGYNMEKEFGAAPTLMVYLISGIIGGAAFIITSSPTSIVVGASGAIFGLMAYLTLVRPFQITPMPFFIPMPIALATVIYAILVVPVFLSGNISSFGNVAQSAHIGGLIGGSLMAFAMNYAQALKGLVVVLITAIIVLALPALLI